MTSRLSFPPLAFRWLLPVALLLAAFAAPARAQLITNGGFESPGFTPAPDYYKYLASSLSTANAITGWNNNWLGANAPTYWMTVGGAYNANIGSGSFAVQLDTSNILSTSFSVTTGQSYAVSFLSRTDATLAPGALQVTANGQSANFTPNATFATYSYNFTANTTGAVSLAFQLSGGNVSLDNVSVTPIPEPSTYAVIAGAGALGLAGWYRRRRARGGEGLGS